MIVKNCDGPFTVVANEAAQDKELTWKAKGLLLYLLSLPEDWTIRLSHLAEQAQDGITATRSAMNELQQRGYVVAHGRERKEDGTYGENVYTVSSRKQIKPEKVQPTREKPTLEKPTLDFPMWDKLALQKKEKTKEIKTKETIKNPLPPGGGNQTAEPLVLGSEEEGRKEKKIQISRMELPSWISRESWQDFIQHRKALRKPMTQRAAELILSRLTKIAADHGETGAQLALLDAIANGWQSPYPPKDQAFRGQGNYQTASDRSNELLDRWLKEGDNGNEEHNCNSTQDMGSEHRQDDSQRSSRALAGGVQGGSRQSVHSSPEAVTSRDAGEELSDDWASLGIATESSPRRSLFG